MLFLAWGPRGLQLDIVSRGQVCLPHGHLAYLDSAPPQGLGHNREETVIYGPKIPCAINLKEILLWEEKSMKTLVEALSMTGPLTTHTNLREFGG